MAEHRASPASAIPSTYYFMFAVYEPLLTVTGFIGALADPKRTHDGQAPWPFDTPPSGSLPKATLVTIIQLGHVCALVGVVNAFVLSAARKHLASQPAVQEKLVRSLLMPLVVGDIVHLGVTLWALGDTRWQVWRWGGLLWTTMILGLSLLIPRILWHIGLGRYKHSRDGSHSKTS